MSKFINITTTITKGGGGGGGGCGGAGNTYRLRPPSSQRELHCVPSDIRESGLRRNVALKMSCK